MAGVDGIDEVILNLHGHLLLGCRDVLDKELYAALYLLVLVLEILQPVGYEIAQGLHVLLGQREFGDGLEGDGVAHVAALPAGKTGVELFDGLADKAYHEFVGVAAALVNLQSGVAAAQALQRDAHGSVVGVGVSLLVVEGGGDVDATGGADDKLAPVLGVEVHEDVALQYVGLEVVGTKHACFLVSGDEGIDGSVTEGLVLHDGHDGCHAQSVVGAEGGATGLDPLTVNPRLYGVGLEVMGGLGCLLRHHVHVGLQYDALTVFHALRGGFAENDVSGFIL